MKLARVRNLSLPSKRLVFIAIASIFVAFATSFAIYIVRSHTDNAYATLAGFDPGNIMDNAVMSNNYTMSEKQIQSFLDSKNTCKTNPKNPAGLVTINSAGTEGTGTWGGVTYKYHMKDSKFICVADQDFDGESAAHIIYQAAQDYYINPQVLIVLLQKEQGIITDNWPNYNVQYRSATGYGCPDTSACDTQYYGFKNQIRNAANMFHTLLQGYGVNNYPIGVNDILYNPDRTCGSSKVNVKNLATGALYTYTPYQPNDAALAAGWGTAPCGAYGNRNFYNYFTDWFGSTRYNISGSIGIYYNSHDGPSTLGMPIENESPINGGYKQCFNNGCIIGGKGIYYSVMWSIRSFYIKNPTISAYLGLPIAEEAILGTASSDHYQQFQYGYIAGRATTGYYAVRGGIASAYSPTRDAAKLGAPIENEAPTAGGNKQCFDNGCIAGVKGLYYPIAGSIYTYWKSQGGFNSPFGLPTSTATTNGGSTVQTFSNGIIAVSGSNTFQVLGSIGRYYVNNPSDASNLGLPIANEATFGTSGRDHYQQFQYGYIAGRATTGYYAVRGGIASAYSPTRDAAKLGAPIENEAPTIDRGHKQCFDSGCIVGARGVYYPISGSIYTKYRSLNLSELDRLGLPIAAEYFDNTSELYKQRFSGGEIWGIKGAYKVTYN